MDFFSLRRVKLVYLLQYNSYLTMYMYSCIQMQALRTLYFHIPLRSGLAEWWCLGGDKEQSLLNFDCFFQVKFKFAIKIFFFFFSE